MTKPFGLGVTCLRPLADDALRGLSARVRTYSDGGWHVSMYLDSSDGADRLVDVLERAGASIRSFRFGMRRASNDEFTDPESLSVGALLLSDGYCHADPANAFDPVFPPPHQGRVPEHALLLVDRRPDYPVCNVLDEKIFSEELCRFLQRHADCDLGDVVYGGRVLPGWHRLFPRRTVNVVPPAALYETPCVACGTKLCTHPGIPVGRRVDALTVGWNATGMDHAGLYPPVVVSVPVAKELIGKRLRGFGIEPIIDIESDVGRQIVALTARLSKIKLPAPAGRSEVRDGLA